MTLFCLKFVCLFNHTADVHLTQNQSTLCPMLPYSLSFSNVIPIPHTAVQLGGEWVLNDSWKWSEEVSRHCDGIYPHPRAWFNSTLQSIAIFEKQHVRDWETRQSYITWSEGVQLMSLVSQGSCCKIRCTALLRFVFPNSFTCFNLSPNRLVLQKTCSTIWCCCQLH